MVCNRHGELDADDIYTYPSGYTKCRLCNREHMRAMRARHRRQRGRPRLKKRSSTAKLTRYQIHAAHALYQAGMSINEIARLGWKRWGHASEHAASLALSRAFRLDGLNVRAQTRKPAPCAQCGCPPEQRTPRCVRCKDRHNTWARQGKPHVAENLRMVCSGCGCDMDERTRGCRNCLARHWQRRKAAPAELAEAA